VESGSDPLATPTPTPGSGPTGLAALLAILVILGVGARAVRRR